MRVIDHSYFMTDARTKEKIWRLTLSFDQVELSTCRGASQVSMLTQSCIDAQLPKNARVIFVNDTPMDKPFAQGMLVHVRYALPCTIEKLRKLRGKSRFTASYGPRRRPTSQFQQGVRIGKMIVAACVQELT